MTEFTERPSPFSVKVAATVVGLVGIGIAGAMGLWVLLMAAIGLTGAIATVWAGRRVTIDAESTTNTERAVASTVLVFGTILLLIPVFQLSPIQWLVVFPYILSVAYIGFAGSEAFEEENSHHLNRLYWRSRDIVVVATLLIVALYIGFVQSVVTQSISLGYTLISSSSMVSILVLEVLLYLFIVAVPKAQHMLETQLDTPAAREVAGIRLGGKRLDKLLPTIRKQARTYWWLFALQIVPIVALPRFLDLLLSQIPVFGGLIQGVLAFGVLHIPVAVVTLLASLTICVGYFHKAVLRWASIDPPRMIASGVGGFVAATLVGIPSVLVPDILIDAALPEMYASVATVYSPALVILGGVALLLLIMPLLLLTFVLLVSLSRLTNGESSGFQVAGLLVLGGTLVAGWQGLPSVLVFASIAAMMIVWDLGEYSTSLGLHMGDRVRTQETEVVHAAATIGVGLIALGVVSMLMYLVGPIDVQQSGVGTDRAALAVVLALVGVLSFSVLLTRE